MMINIQRIGTSDMFHYNYMEELLTQSFPLEEYRDLHVLREITDTIPRFRNNVIRKDNTPIGFVSYWDLDAFYYIEHFAIDPAHRSGGYGKQLLKVLTGQLNRPVVLEVEFPNEETAMRRISFYERQQFVLWQREYYQPPYRKSDNALPMHLMVWGDLNCENDFEYMKQIIYREVYNFSDSSS